jgi:two-component system sensor histidine kinase KdpD
VTVDDTARACRKGREEAMFQKFERGRKGARPPASAWAWRSAARSSRRTAARSAARRASQGGARFTFELPRGEPPALDQIEDDKAGQGARA